MERRARRLLALHVLLPIVVGLHAWLLWLGGVWRVLAIVDAGVGVFLVLAMREAKRLG